MIGQTKNQELRAKNQELRAKNQEPRTKNIIITDWIKYYF